MKCRLIAVVKVKGGGTSPHSRQRLSVVDVNRLTTGRGQTSFRLRLPQTDAGRGLKAAM
jgi:hypothetical protein